MVVVANQGIFGQGVFSMRGAALAKIIGQRKIEPACIKIARSRGTELCADGVRRNGVSPPFMPKTMADEYHPGGNSLCYTIQTAHLMGAERIYGLAFTLKSGDRYFFGSRNPVTKKASLYDDRRALDWLAWYEGKWPGKVRLLEGWDGPAYDVLQTASCAELMESGGAKTEPDDDWIL